MKRALSVSVIALAGCALAAIHDTALAQSDRIKFSNVAGIWEGKSMVGPTDSVFTTWVLKATADRKGWTLKRANRSILSVRIIAVGGDSIVYESGPYPSILRPGQMARTRITGHFDGDKMTGSWEAHYKSGDVARGKVEATRKR